MGSISFFILRRARRRKRRGGGLSFDDRVFFLEHFVGEGLRGFGWLFGYAGDFSVDGAHGSAFLFSLALRKCGDVVFR